MSSLEVQRLGAGDLGAALAFPASIYEGDPNWVPPLRVWELRRLRARLKRGGLALFAARRGGRIVGTISTLKDENFDRDPAERLCWFGYFECEHDPDAAAALLDAAAAQARAWGAHAIRGPRNLSRFEFVGLTVRGYESPPPMLQAHHPPYYQGLLEGAGLVKHHDVYAYETALFESDGAPRALPAGLRAKADACDVPELTIRRASRLHLKRDLLLAHGILNESYATVPDVQPMPEATFVGLGRAFSTIADTELIQIGFSGDRPVGFAVCFPEINEALARCRGRLSPLGWARLLYGLTRIRSAGFKLIGVVPDLRGSGLHAAMIRAIVQGAQRAGYSRIDGSVIDERNKPMRGVVEGAGMEIYRVYRFYQRSV